MTQAQEKYQEYLNSDEWKQKRQFAFDRAKGRCQLCYRKDKPLHGHHRTYAHLHTIEELNDVVVLCEECHEKFHANSETKPVSVIPLEGFVNFLESFCNTAADRLGDIITIKFADTAAHDSIYPDFDAVSEKVFGSFFSAKAWALHRVMSDLSLNFTGNRDDCQYLESLIEEAAQVFFAKAKQKVNNGPSVP